MSQKSVPLPTDPNRIVVRNPATGEELGSVPISSPEQVRATVERARAAQAEWRERPLVERCRVLQQVKERLFARTAEVRDLLCREMGKTPVEAMTTEITNLAGLIDYYARRAPRILAPEPIPMSTLKHRASYLHFPPRGVIGIIGPWNFPLILDAGPAAMALIAGNAVVVKPSEFTPLIQDLAREIFVEGGVPEDLYGVVHGRGETGAALIDAGIDMMIFTGSVRTGRKVAAACGERLIPCVTELGGKAPALVLDDADIPRTARALAWGGFANCGQICASVERVLVHEKVADALLEELLPLVQDIVPGDPTKADTQMGPLNNARQLRVVEDLIADAVEQGARVVAGGSRIEGPGLFYEPTVLVDVTPAMRIMNEEIFGPVLPILRLPDTEALIAEANRSHLGLMAYVFGRDRERARRVAERLEAGTVMVNDVLTTHGMPETPWGGVKQSGIGHTHSDQGLRDLCQQRHVNYDLLPPLRRELWWYPYSAKQIRRFERLQQILFGSSLRQRWRGLWGR